VREEHGFGKLAYGDPLRNVLSAKGILILEHASTQSRIRTSFHSISLYLMNGIGLNTLLGRRKL
jgi:hypothetical protein